MADWTHVPSPPYNIQREPPPTLISKFEDGTEIRRLKASNERRTFTERYTVSDTVMDSMLDFYELRGIFTKFTKVSYDANEAPATEVTVRFKSAPSVQEIGYLTFQAEFVFIELIGE